MSLVVKKSSPSRFRVLDLHIVVLVLSLLGSTTHEFMFREASPEKTRTAPSRENLCESPCRTFASTRLMSSTSSAAAAANESGGATDSPKKNILRVLALHGSGGDAKSFTRTMSSWNDFLATETSSIHHASTSAAASAAVGDLKDYEFQFSAVSGPVQQQDGGLSWWSMPPLVRSFNATTYTGFEESATVVLDQLAAMSELSSSPSSSSSSSSDSTTKTLDEEGRGAVVDLVIGHSQGAILTTALLALEKIPTRLSPRLGYILNGVAWPNPFTQQLESLRLIELSPPCPLSSSSSSSSSSNNDASSSMNQNRVLILIGRADSINPPQQAFRVKEALHVAGFHVTVIEHDGGHAVPVPSTRHDTHETMRQIMDWIAQGL
jgi:predicted esterase